MKNWHRRVARSARSMGAMNEAGHSGDEKEEKLPLSKATLLLLEECRMVLPGLQALFGFQLIVVFNNRFAEVLSAPEQRLHLAAIGLVAVAVALIMTPAAYHRQKHTHKATEKFVRISSRLLLWSMPPLAVSLCLEFYLICRVILGGGVGVWLAAALFALLFFLWFVLPRVTVLDRVFGVKE
jgi:hypothetical protein